MIKLITEIQKIQEKNDGDFITFRAKCLSATLDEGSSKKQSGKIGDGEDSTFYSYPDGSKSEDDLWLQEGETYTFKDAMVISSGDSSWKGILIRSKTKVIPEKQEVEDIEVGRECEACGENLRTNGKIKSGGKPELGYKYIKCINCKKEQPLRK